jgi:hypothetical protein
MFAMIINLVELRISLDWNSHKLMYTYLEWLSFYVFYGCQLDKVRIFRGTNNVIENFSNNLFYFLNSQVVCYEFPSKVQEP